jgi:hypothetical protein
VDQSQEQDYRTDQDNLEREKASISIMHVLYLLEKERKDWGVLLRCAE